MNVLCATPLQIPVHRVRATVRCRELGTQLHRTVHRLQAPAGGNRELIAAATGLPLGDIARVQAELARELAPSEREYLVWVDHARERCLPYSALDGAVVVRRKDEGLTLPLEAPTPASLEHMGLSVAASWDSGIDGHVEIEEVLDVIADARGAVQGGSRGLPHVLRLPDVHLLFGYDQDDPHRLRTTLTQHALDSPELTNWLHEHFDAYLCEHLIDLSHLAEVRPLPPPWIAELIERSRSAEIRPWKLREPHPARTRSAILAVAQAASERLDICAPSLTELPEWLRKAIEDTRARDVPVVLRPAAEEASPKRLDVTQMVLDGQPDALCVIADTSTAAVHTDPEAALDRGEQRAPRPQHLALTSDRVAVQALQSLYGLEPPKRRKPSERLGQQLVHNLLDRALDELAAELSAGVSPTITLDDEQAATEALDRYHRPGDVPTAGMHAVAAGIAWERIAIATATNLCAQDERLALLATRWVPPQGGIDLDLILADEHKRIVWVIDAKNRTPAAEQEGKMIYQLRILRTASDFIPEHWHALGLIVHPARHLSSAPHQTEQPEILRCNLHDLESLLQADSLPEERIR
jgi:hypothetical protein